MQQALTLCPMKCLVIAAALIATVLTTACGSDSPAPAATATPSEFLVRGDCFRRADEEAGRIYGQDADLNSNTDRFNEFFKDVILVGLTYGRDETALVGSDFEEAYLTLVGESAYVSERRKEAWDYQNRLFDECIEAQGIAAQPDPALDTTTRCVAEGVARAWSQYGDHALDYTDEILFIFDEQPSELSIGEAWQIAVDYQRKFGESPFKNPAAFELATSGGCDPWQGEAGGVPIAGP